MSIIINNSDVINPILEVRYPSLNNMTIIEYLRSIPLNLYGTSDTPPSGVYPNGTTYDQYESTIQ